MTDAVPSEVDLLILGSGSTAFAAALRAQELGKSVVMTEERTLGGTCVNRGCLPSKNLIEAARLVHEAAHPRIPGIEPVRVPFDFRAPRYVSAHRADHVHARNSARENTHAITHVATVARQVWHQLDEELRRLGPGRRPGPRP